MTSDTTGRANATDRHPFHYAAVSDAPEAADHLSEIGLVEGAPVITCRGARPVETLAAGDLVVTRDCGVVPILRIEQRSIVARAVYVLAGTLGHRMSLRDTLLPASQPVLVRDWRAHALFGKREALVPVSTLIDGEFIRDLGQMPMTVYRIYCRQPQVLYADSMELGTADTIMSGLSQDGQEVC